MTGDGYVLRGNTVSNNRGRGTILKGSQGMVENNRFTYNHFAGVLVRSPAPARRACLRRHRRPGRRPSQYQALLSSVACCGGTPDSCQPAHKCVACLTWA